MAEGEKDGRGTEVGDMEDKGEREAAGKGGSRVEALNLCLPLSLTFLVYSLPSHPFLLYIPSSLHLPPYLPPFQF